MDFLNVVVGDEEIASKLVAKEHADRIVLSKILPPELWTKVFERVKEDETLESVSNSSLYFRTLLSTEKTRFLFPKVLSLVQSKLVRKTPNDPRSASEPILNCRLVCKTWNEAIEHLCEDKCCRGENWHFTKHRTAWFEADNLVSHFQDTHVSGNETKSPLLGRSIRFDVTHDDSFANVQAMLHLYGEHFWDVVFTNQFYDYIIGHQNASNFYGHMHNMLACMPNLRRLKLNFHFNLFRRGVLIPFMNENPLPALQHLHTLELENVPFPIFNMLLANNPGIEKLMVGCMQRLEHINMDNFLQLNLKSLEFYYRNEQEFLVFENLATRSRSELSVLKLATFGDYINWFRILNLLSTKWSDSLDTLFLEFPKAELDTEFDVCQEMRVYKGFQFNRLKHVTISLRNFVSFDFLLPIRNTLETLKIKIVYNLISEHSVELLLDVEKSQKVQIVGRELSSLSSSNVWELFPGLKRVEYQTICCNKTDVRKSALPVWLKNQKAVCSREQYESFKKQQ